MKRFYYLAVAVAILGSTLSASAQTTAYGYTMMPSTSPVMISFTTDEPSAVTSMGSYSKAEPRSGAAVNNILYMMGVDDDYNVWFYRMNMESGESTTIKKLGEVSVPGDMSYDYSTETMYSISNSEEFDGVSALRTVNLSTGQFTVVKENLGYYCKAIAVDARGQMYLLTGSGLLLKTSKNSGTSEVIGSTGITFAGWWNFQSMEFDRKSGILYLAAWTSDGKSELYTIDTATAHATLVGTIGDGTHTIALSIPYEPTSANAPERVSDLTLTPDPNGELMATLSWVNPVYDYSGNPLEEGTVSIKIVHTASGQDKTFVGCNPGQAMETMFEVESNGMNEFTVTAFNEAGSSLEEIVEGWIGHDSPAAVGNATASLNRNELLVNDLSWEAPTTGAHGGYIHKESLKYDIVRINDSQIIAKDLTVTSFSDENLLAELTRYSYHIIAKNVDGIGEIATTNDLVNGPAVEWPYVAPFNSWQESGQYWTVIDANKDGYPFVWYNDFMNMFGLGENKGFYIYQKHDENNANDFIVSPPIKFTAGHEYRITATVSNDDIAGYREESFKFVTMPGYDVTEAKTLGNGPFTVKHPGDFRDYSVTFTAEQDGNGTFTGFIGLCCTSRYDMGMLLVSAITVEDITGASFIRGDVNNDGKVSIDDVTALIACLMNNTTPANPEGADCKADGKLSIEDVTTLIAYLLNGVWPE